jgi:hypothetical protein
LVDIWREASRYRKPPTSDAPYSIPAMLVFARDIYHKHCEYRTEDVL